MNYRKWRLMADPLSPDDGPPLVIDGPHLRPGEDVAVIEADAMDAAHEALRSAGETEKVLRAEIQRLKDELGKNA